MTSWHEDYKARYKKLKESGKPFFPYAVFKDTLAACLIFAALAALAWKVGAGLEALADPTDTTYNPRPEWYFLFLFQALKAFPGSLEAVAAVVLPGAIVGLLFVLPLLDRGPKRHPLDRPLLTGLGALAIAAVSALTVLGARSPLLNPVVEKDPMAAQGARLYNDLNCAYCHKVRGKGGEVGPQLDRVVGRESDEWLEQHFRDPRSFDKTSKMPQLHLLDDEIKALTAYMRSIGTEPYTKEAPKLFADNCAACHKLGGEGGEVGPDLSRIGSARDKAYIKQYTADPAKIFPATTMPPYKGELTDVQLEDLARYLASLGR